MGSTKYPELKKDPVVEATFEIRFVPSNEIEEFTIGSIVGGLAKVGFENAKELPSKAVPFAIRKSDANLKYQSTIQIRSSKHKNISAKVGPFVLSISCHHPYPLWATFSQELKSCVEALKTALPIQHIERLGLRYINVLTGKTSISESTNCKLELPVAGQPKQQLIRSEIQSGKFSIGINVGETIQGQLVRNDGTALRLEGLLVDIDVFQQGTFKIEQIPNWLDEAHIAEKDAFFNIVKDDALKEYK